MSIKAQALADFIVECTIPESLPVPNPEDKVRDGEKTTPWVLFVDGAVNPKGSGAGIVFQGPEGIQL